jgi:hypothetical protein
MSDELEALLKLVADGRLTAEEAAPIVAALEERERAGAGRSVTDEARAAGGGRSRRAGLSAEEALTGRRLRLYVAQNGRPVVNMRIPLTAAGIAIDQVPGLSPDHRSRIAEAIRDGMTGPILEVADGDDEVRIVIE